MRNRRLPVMISIVLAMLVSSMDTTIIHTTMPVIAEELGGQELFTWTFAAYMILSTVVAPIAGRLSDLFGRKWVFAMGIILFMIGSVLCGQANTMLQLVIYRAVQGFGAGFMMPFPAIIAGDLFSIEKRGKIQAFFSAMWGLSAVLAPLLGAAFVEHLSWRWIFYVNVPVCIIAFLLLLVYEEAFEPKRAKVDGIGAIIFAAGISLVLLTTVVADHQLLYGIVGAVLLTIFVRYEKHHESPIVPLELLKIRPISWMIVNSFLSCAALFGTSSFVPLFLQKEGYSILWSGLPLLAMSIGWTSVSVWAGKWILRWGYRILLLIGNGMLVTSGVMLVLLQEGSGWFYISVALLLQGVAFGLIVTVSIIGAQQLVGLHRKGISTSLQMFARNIGTAIGVTIMGAFLHRATDFYTGITHLFLYSVVVSIAAFATAFFIRVEHGVNCVQED